MFGRAAGENQPPQKPGYPPTWQKKSEQYPWLTCEGWWQKTNLGCSQPHPKLRQAQSPGGIKQASSATADRVLEIGSLANGNSDE